MRRAIFLMLFLSLLQGALSYAALGGAPSSFGITQRKQGAGMLAAADNKADAIYTVSQNTLANGTVVREYRDIEGQVFAVSWNGTALPDLSTLLGTHFDSMTASAAQGPKAAHTQLALERPDVVIVSNGHRPAFNGRAWIPTALPAGFSSDSIE
jgi:hypothetical protein